MSGKILVVDYGRTHLRACLLSVDDEDTAGTRILSRSSLTASEPISPSDPSAAAGRLLSLASSLTGETGLGLSDLCVASAGLAGYGRDEDCRTLEQALKDGGSPFPWLVESDAQQTLRTAREAGPVAVALLGTGSAFFARDANGVVHRTGGHGALLEDYGSAFEISRQAILAMMRGYDGMGPDSRLFAALRVIAGSQDALEFRGKIMENGFAPAEWARFAPAVLQEAEAGEFTAVRILDRQLERVVDCLWALIHKAGLPLGAPIRCSGGMVEKNPFYLRRVVEAIGKGLPDYPCGLVECESWIGGWRLASQWLEKTSQGGGGQSVTG